MCRWQLRHGRVPRFWRWSARICTNMSSLAESELHAHILPTSQVDLENIQRLDVEVYGDSAYSYVTLRQFMDIGGELFRVCKDSANNVIAYGVIASSASRDSGWLLSLVISPHHRRKGIGTTLVNQLLHKAIIYSLEKIYVTVAPRNFAAISLYTRLGFAAVNHEHHYFGRNEDRIVMCRLLSS